MMSRRCSHPPQTFAPTPRNAKTTRGVAAGGGIRIGELPLLLLLVLCLAATAMLVDDVLANKWKVEDAKNAHKLVSATEADWIDATPKASGVQSVTSSSKIRGPFVRASDPGFLHVSYVVSE